MVQMGAYSNLLDFKEEFVNNNPLAKDFPTLANDTKILGVTSMFDMITTIIAFDNNLDWRVVQMTLLFLEYNFLKYCNDNKKKVENIKYSRLVEDKNENGELMAKICVESGQEFYTPFPMPVYEHCLKEYKERLDIIDPFVFDRNMRDHFCNFFEEDFQTQEEHKNDYYYVEDDEEQIETK